MSEKKVEDKNNDSEKKPTAPPIQIKPPTINVPKIEPPKVNIRPEVQKTIDNLLPSLTQNEWEYLIQRIKMFLKTNVKSSMRFGKESAEPDLLYKEMTEGLRELEEVVTVGYPKFFASPTEPKDNDMLEAIIDLVKPLFESPKVQDQFARILGAIADKLDGKA